MNSTSTIKCSKCGKAVSRFFDTWLLDGSPESVCLACWEELQDQIRNGKRVGGSPMTFGPVVADNPIADHRPALDLNQVVTLPEATELVNRSSNSVWKQLQTGLINARFCTIAGKKRGIWIIGKQSLIDHYAKLGEADEN